MSYAKKLKYINDTLEKGNTNCLWKWRGVIFNWKRLQNSHYNIFTELNESIIVKEPVITMLHKIETYNKDIKTFLNNRLEILMLRS